MDLKLSAMWDVVDNVLIWEFLKSNGQNIHISKRDWARKMGFTRFVYDPLFPNSMKSRLPFCYNWTSNWESSRE